VRASWCLSIAVLAAVPAAQVLPFKSFGTRQGLPHENVAALFEDSRGLLWIGTWEGLACFDGASFTSYGAAEGLTSSVPFEISEDGSGDVWFGVHGTGIARLAFASGVLPEEKRIQVFQVGGGSLDNSIEALVFLGGRAWIASSAGLHSMTLDAAHQPRFEPRWKPDHAWSVQGVSRQGARAWILSPRERVEVTEDGFTVAPGPGEDPGFDVRAEPGRDGRALVYTTSGLFEFTPPERWTEVPFDLPEGARVKATTIGPDGTRWIGTTRGLFQLGASGVERLGRANGLPSESVSNLLFDRAGHLWIGTHDGGLCVLAAPSPVTFLLDGEPVWISRLVPSPAGRILAAGAAGIYAVGARGLELVPGTDRPPLERTEGFLYRDRAGDLWIGSTTGLYRAPGPDLEPDRLDGPLLAGKCAGPVTEDHHGRLWVSAADAVFAREPGGEFERVLDWLDPDDGIREVFVGRDESVWLIGWRRLWRRSGGELDEIRIDGRPPQVRTMLEDRSGRLWLGLRTGGLAWTEDAGAAEPHFARFRQEGGLPSDTVWSLAEGPRGELWAATGRGLVRLDPARLAARESAGLETWSDSGGSAAFHVLCTDEGIVWAATSAGVVRVDPDVPAEAGALPTVSVQGFEAAGEALDVPEAGTLALSGIVLPHDKNSVNVRFGGIDLVHGDELRFQTRLAGTEWSAPGLERSLHLARLEPGNYHLEIRSIARDERVSPTSAVVDFRVLAPVWRRPWFLALAALALAMVVFGLHRVRLARLLALERVRAQIAGDLHDEVGAGLAQISILSEVARRESGAAVAERLGEVAELARATRASMSDLVWAIRPEEDRLGALVARMQAAAEQMLEPAGVELAFHAPPEETLARVALGPEARRQLLLFFKEALTNAARHAQAGRVSVALTLAGGELHLAIEDDGRGFDPLSTSNGHGLPGLRERAARLGGRLELASSPGQGTRVSLAVPAA
jgi:signal transduction histidine kinase/ligand-binding sensor domain-containing protein